jgi:uncharacterized protein YheU (UPF0270 family)
MLVIPYTELDPKIVTALVEEFVTRDGAVHGHHDRAMEERVSSVLSQLKSRKVVIVFDEASESCTIVPSDQLPKG